MELIVALFAVCIAWNLVDRACTIKTPEEELEEVLQNIHRLRK